MSHSPFDGVLLADPRPPIPGAVALLLHLRVARRLAAELGRPAPGLEAVQARAQACQELLAHGLLPQQLRGLPLHGLHLGSAQQAHSLASLIEHLASYLQEVDASGYLEPDAALWEAMDRQEAGGRGFWVERSAQDSPLLGTVRDLQPARLRVLACAPGLEGTLFLLATRRGDGSSGLFGSSQGLADWFLEGLEEHGHQFPNSLFLVEPPGWGDAPWGGALERLFEGPLDLGEHADQLQRGLVEGPVDLLFHAVEQVCTWVEAGIPAPQITVVHPEPMRVAGLLAPLFAAEGLSLHVQGGLVPLIESASWSPLWTLLQGLQRLDPCAFSAGLRASQRRDFRTWADHLAATDQCGASPFTQSLVHLEPGPRAHAEALWAQVSSWREARLSGSVWVQRIEELAGALHLDLDPEAFFAPLGLLKESWTEADWGFPDMLTSLQAFLQAARAAGLPREPEGVRLISPAALLEGWTGAEATLVLDLSEGAWPARPLSNPDLDGDRKAALNRALRAATPGSPARFPPALQQFWLPRSETGSQLPRAFQREAYGFNKALALTRRHFIALSPGQDEEGRLKAQGPFWTALEGAGTWAPSPARCASGFRWTWEGHAVSPVARARASASQARPQEDSLQVPAPDFDRVPDLREKWMKGGEATSPTALEGLARCPFRSLADRVWRVNPFDAATRLRLGSGTLAHRVLEATLQPFLGSEDWPTAFLDAHGLGAEGGAEHLTAHLEGLWRRNRDGWLAALQDLPEEHWPRLSLDLESLLPNLAEGLLLDARAPGPTKWELALLYPDQLPPQTAERARKLPLQEGWTRKLLGLESELGPVDFPAEGDRLLRVIGTTDRLERWTNPALGLAFLRVTDYKTSRAQRLKAFAEPGAPLGTHLQTPLYALMAERHHALPATAALLPLRDEEPKAFTEPMAELARTPDWRQRLSETLARLEARLESGDFPSTPGSHCQGCALSALCGRPVDVLADEEED